MLICPLYPREKGFEVGHLNGRACPDAQRGGGISMIADVIGSRFFGKKRLYGLNQISVRDFGKGLP